MVPSGGNDVRFWDQHGDRSSRGVQTSQSQALDVDHRVNDYDRPILDEFKGNLGRWGIPRAVANKLATWFLDRRDQQAEAFDSVQKPTAMQVLRDYFGAEFPRLRKQAIQRLFADTPGGADPDAVGSWT